MATLREKIRAVGVELERVNQLSGDAANGVAAFGQALSDVGKGADSGDTGGGGGGGGGGTPGSPSPSGGSDNRPLAGGGGFVVTGGSGGQPLSSRGAPSGGSVGGRQDATTGRYLGPPPVPDLCREVYDHPIVFSSGAASGSKPVLVGWICQLSVDPPQAPGFYSNGPIDPLDAKLSDRGAPTGAGGGGRSDSPGSRPPSPIGTPVIPGGGEFPVDPSKQAALDLAQSAALVTASAKSFAADMATVNLTMKQAAGSVTKFVNATGSLLGDPSFVAGRERL